MSKKRERQKPLPQKRKMRGKRKGMIAITVALSLSLAVIILGQWRNTLNPSSTLSTVPQPVQTPQLSKEYIYAGGKLIATEEPGGSSPLSAPSSLIATGASSPTGTPPPQVTLTWAASTGGAVAHYEVERMQNITTGYTVVNSNVTATSYTDTSVSADAAYLYRVRAVDPQGNFTTYSNVDLATAITFTDNPLVSYAENHTTATPVRAAHVTELRRAVNSVRALANLSAVNWADDVQPLSTVYATHVTDLRSNLAAALTALGLSAPSYTYPTLTPHSSLIHKEDIQELRDVVK